MIEEKLVLRTGRMAPLPKAPIVPFLCDYCGEMGISRFSNDNPFPICDPCKSHGAVEQLVPYRAPEPRKFRMAM